MQKKGLSEVVTTVLMVLLALGAILIVWFLVRGVITKAGEQVDISKITTSFNIVGKSVYVNVPLKSVSLVVERAQGAGTVSGFNVIVEDASGVRDVNKWAGEVKELESKAITVSYADSTIGTPTKVSVAPVFKSATTGEETIGDVAASYAATSANVHAKNLNFDGITGAVSIPSSSSLNVGSITVSLWVKPTAAIDCAPGIPNNWRSLISKGYYPADNGWNIILEQLMNQYAWRVPINPGSSEGRSMGPATTTAVPGSWWHLIFTYDSAGTMSEYVNAVSVTTNPVPVTAGAIRPNNSPVVIAGGTNAVSCPDGGGYLPAVVKDVRIYNKALSAADVSKLYGNGIGDDLGTVSDGLVGWWRLDEGEGTTAKDSSGKGNNGNIVGTTNWV